MTRGNQVAIGVGAGVLGALILGNWGSLGGLRGMTANAVGSSLLPLAAYLVVKARNPERPQAVEDEAPEAPLEF